jgi:hypothetical protein
MKTSLRCVRSASVLLGCLVCALSIHAQEDSRLLWQIGLPDGRNSEFALAPGSYKDFKTDSFFVVGESDAKRDWTYVQPGPGDAWAGSRIHTFTVLFNLKTGPGKADSRLKVALLDTHSSNPPKLRIEVNGHEFEQSLPRGGGDASIAGQLGSGRPYKFEIALPPDVLRVGDNDIQITATTGSWLLYDWIGLATPAGAELGQVSARTVVANVQAIRAVREANGPSKQPVLVTLRHFGEPVSANVLVEGAAARSVQLVRGDQTVELEVPAVSQETSRAVTVEAGGQKLATRNVLLRPVRKLSIYVLPHSHTDIGYTEIQTAIEKKQVNNLLEGIAAARRTADYPEGARFVWNVEVLWAADLYLHRLSESQRAEFFEAVRKGWVGLNGMYLNELTGLCRPEELLELFRYATKLSEECGVKVDSAMISDVPGYTWGTVPAMAQAGIRYFSTAPNYFDRIGNILVEWENKPFWWQSPSERERVLVWIPYMGYAMSHLIHHFTPQFVDEYQAILEKEAYPYDIAYVRWSGHGDNAVPDPVICEFFKDWNTKYTWPKFIIARTSDAFHAFEARYGDQLPVVRGDWTPYWEDGAGSSALETALNRNTSDKLVQAQALFAMHGTRGYPAGDFEKAWRNTLLYSEHTWGADCSVSSPESAKTKEQWEIKQGYALQADREARALLDRGLSELSPDGRSADRQGPASGQIDVFNTTSWSRTEVVVLSKKLSSPGDRVGDDSGRPIPSQRLADGELAFLARDVPPFGTRRFTVAAGDPVVEGHIVAGPDSLDNGLVRVRVDQTTGGIVEFVPSSLNSNLADTTAGEALNDFIFLPGEDLKKIQRNGQVKITLKERGPLLASLLIESDAPSCRKLAREVRITTGYDYVEVIDVVDKERAAIPAQPGDGAFAQKGGKESINFAFPFRVPDGAVSMDIPLGWMRPEIDQMPSACKNWFTVGRWADVSNREYGVTLVTLDAPLLELGGLTANMTGSQTNPKVWRRTVDRNQRIYIWAMNNHWHTNYRAYQDGPVTFRFVLRPHRQLQPAEASRFATGFSQPLLAMPGRGAKPALGLQLDVQPADVLVTDLKPSDDGKALIIRLFGASGQDKEARFTWGSSAPRQLKLSDTGEKAGLPVSGSVPVPAWDLVTLRAELP